MTAADFIVFPAPTLLEAFAELWGADPGDGTVA